MILQSATIAFQKKKKKKKQENKLEYTPIKL